MPNPNQRKGAATERMVAKYLQANGFPNADRRLREGRRDDQGDIDGVPFTTIQVKSVEANRYAMWVVDTARQRDIAGAAMCLLVRRVPRKPVEQWEALMPSSYFIADFEWAHGGGGSLPEEEAWTWVRMDLKLAVVALKRMTGALRILSDPSSTATWMGSTLPLPETRVSLSAPSTEKEIPPSPTT